MVELLDGYSWTLITSHVLTAFGFFIITAGLIILAISHRHFKIRVYIWLFMGLAFCAGLGHVAEVFALVYPLPFLHLSTHVLAAFTSLVASFVFILNVQTLRLTAEAKVD